MNATKSAEQVVIRFQDREQQEVSVRTHASRYSQELAVAFKKGWKFLSSQVLSPE